MALPGQSLAPPPRVVTVPLALVPIGAFATGAANGFSTYYRFAATEAVPPEWKSRAISYVMAGGIVSALLGSQLALWSQTLIGDHQYAGAFICIGTLQAAVIAILTIASFPQASPRQQETDAGGRSLILIDRQSPLVMSILGAVSSWMIMSLLMHATPLSMHRVDHTFSDTTQVIMCHALAMYAPAFFTGRLVSRFGEWPVMFGGLALTLAASVVNLGGADLVYYYVGLTLLGFGWNFLFIGSTSMLVASHTPSEKARVQSANDALIFASMIFSSFSAGSLEHLVGWQVLNKLALVVTGAVTVVMCLLRWKGPRFPAWGQLEDKNRATV